MDKIALSHIVINRAIFWLKNNLKYIVCVTAILSIAPLLILTFYTHPSADDFLVAVWIKENGLWELQKQHYLNWSGRFVSTAIVIIHPLIYNSFETLRAFFLISFFLYLAILIFFVHTFFKPLSKLQTVNTTLIFFSLYISTLPSTAEAFFWYGGLINYQIPNFLSLLSIAFVFKYLNAKNTIGRKRDYIIVATICNIFIVGCSETFIPFLFIFFTTVLIFNRIIKYKWDFGIIISYLILLIAIGIVFLAPGNSVRMSPQGGDVLFTVFYSLKQGIGNSINWLSDSPILILTLFLISYLVKNDFSSNLIFHLHPLTALFLFLVVFFGSYTPSYWGLASTPPLRTLNSIYFIFLIGWFWTVGTWTNFLKRSYAKSLSVIPNYFRLVLWSFIILMILFKKSSNVRIAYEDLLSGKAHHYNQELKARYILFKKTSEQNIVVKPLKNIPKSIYFSDIGRDKKHWNNEYYAKYFGKESIIIE